MSQGACDGETGIGCEEFRRAVHGTQETLPQQALRSQALLNAARDGDLMSLQYAIADGANLETRQPIAFTLDGSAGSEAEEMVLQRDAASVPGLTPLMYAANYPHFQCAKTLLQAKASVNARDQDGWTPLHFAAYTGSLDIADALVACGAKVDALDNDGSDPLCHLPKDVVASRTLLRKWQESLLSREKDIAGSEEAQLGAALTREKQEAVSETPAESIVNPGAKFGGQV